jgi:hypothetical protein
MNVLSIPNHPGQRRSPRGSAEISADSESSSKSEKILAPPAPSTPRFPSSHHSATVTPTSKSKDGVGRIGASLPGRNLNGRSLHLLFKRSGSSRYLYMDCNDVDDVSIADFNYGDRKASSAMKAASKVTINSASSPRRMSLTLGVGCLSLHLAEPTVATPGQNEESDSLTDSYDGFAATSSHHCSTSRATDTPRNQYHVCESNPRTPTSARSFVNALESSPSAAAAFRVRRRRLSMPHTINHHSETSPPASAGLGTTCHWVMSPGSDRPHLEFSPDLAQAGNGSADEKMLLPKVSLLDDDTSYQKKRVSDVSDGNQPSPPNSPRPRGSGSDRRETALGTDRRPRQPKSRRRQDQTRRQMPRRHSATAVSSSSVTETGRDSEHLETSPRCSKVEPFEPRLSRAISGSDEVKSPSSSPRRKTRRTATLNHISTRRRSSMQHLQVIAVDAV